MYFILFYFIKKKSPVWNSHQFYEKFSFNQKFFKSLPHEMKKNLPLWAYLSSCHSLFHSYNLSHKNKITSFLALSCKTNFFFRMHITFFIRVANEWMKNIFFALCLSLSLSFKHSKTAVMMVPSGNIFVYKKLFSMCKIVFLYLYITYNKKICSTLKIIICCRFRSLIHSPVD